VTHLVPCHASPDAQTADELAKPIAPSRSKEEVEVASDIELCVNETKPTYKGSGVVSTFCAAETHEPC